MEGGVGLQGATWELRILKPTQVGGVHEAPSASGSFCERGGLRICVLGFSP